MTAFEHVLGRARWAARAYQRYSAPEVARIVSAVAAAAQTNAHRLAEEAVGDSGRGVVADRARTHMACANAAREFPDGPDLVSPRVNASGVEVPRPAGVVLALLPDHAAFAHGCVATLFALMTRNAVVIRCPAADPGCVEGLRLLAASAAAAGAPDGVIQCLPEQAAPLTAELLADARVDLVVAPSGITAEPAPVVCGVPVLVDATVDPSVVAAQVIESASFDNALLGVCESVLVVTDEIAEPVTTELTHRGAAVLDGAAVQQLRRYLFPDGRPAAEAAGRDAAWIAHRAGIRVDPETRVLVAPLDLVVPEEPLVHGTSAPVLGMVRVADVTRGVAAARSVVRGRGIAAAVHSTDPAVILRFCTEVPVARVVVNAAGTTAGHDGDARLAEAVAAGMAVAGQAPGLRPEHLLSWTRVTSNGMRPGLSAHVAASETRAADRGPVPPYPVASNAKEGVS